MDYQVIHPIWGDSSCYQLSPKFYQFYEDTGGTLTLTTSCDMNDWNSSMFMDVNLKVKGIFKVKKGDFRRKKLKTTETLVILD